MSDIITDIHARLAALEIVVLGHAAEQPVDAAHDCRLTKRQLAQRRGKSPRTIDRDVKRGTLPPPEYENGRAYWWLSVLQCHERKLNQSKPQRHFARNNRVSV